MKKVFVSRKLSKGSPLNKLKLKYQVIDKSLIEFHGINISFPIISDWIFFYSRNGIKFFSLAMQNSNVTLGHHRIACMGKGTADEFYNIFRKKPDFTGNGNPSEVADQFLSLVKPTDVILFICAIKSNHSVERKISNKVKTISIPVYTNNIQKSIVLPNCQIGIFTSPLNVEAYNSTYDIKYLDIVIAIGKTTAKKIHECGVHKVVIATESSDLGLMKAFEIAISDN